MASTATKNYTFTWVGTNREGVAMKGETLGASQALVKAQLRQQGINPSRIRKKTTLFGLGGGQRKKKIKAGDISVFARQLATMMEAGVPLVQALDIIAKGSDNPSLTRLVTDIRDHIESGSTLAASLAEHPKYF
ncbi:MAG TPA: type II secretion system F family protein, partial [Salinisphaeraceae bacterium]|nr:type II secretion system F family protein [Salinisphaeraceae bacterium]